MTSYFLTPYGAATIYWGEVIHGALQGLVIGLLIVAIARASSGR